MMAASPMRAQNAGVFSGQKELVVRVDRRTGRLVRGPAPEPRKSASTANPKRAALSALVEQTARTHNLDPLLVDSVIQVESNYDPYAVSSKGAEGLMQLMPSTARMLGVSNSFDPQQNIEAGVRYLKQLKDLYKDDRLALAAYNAGPGAVDKYKWVPPFRETQVYVNEVGRRYEDARKTADATKAAEPPKVVLEEKPVAVTPAEEKHPKLEQFVDEHGRLHLSTKRE